MYIAEAHAIDEWPISSGRYNKDGAAVSLKQTHSTPERAMVARDFFERYESVISISNLLLYSIITGLSYSYRYMDAIDTGVESPWKCVIACPEEDGAHDGALTFEDLYKPWPFRAYGFVDDKIDLVAEPHACEVRIGDLREWVLSKAGVNE